MRHKKGIPPPDIPGGEAEKAKGMDRAARAANPAWMAQMAAHSLTTALRYRKFTTDTVYHIARRAGMTVETHEHRALGPIIAHMAAQEWIVKADCAPVMSDRRSLHRSPLTVWVSQVCHENAPDAPSVAPAPVPNGTITAKVKPDEALWLDIVEDALEEATVDALEEVAV